MLAQDQVVAFMRSLEDRSLTVRRRVRRRGRLLSDMAATSVEECYLAVVNARSRRGVLFDRRSGRTPREDLVADYQSSASTWRLAQTFVDKGADPADLARAVLGVTEVRGGALARDLRRRAPAMLREHRASERGFRRRLRATHGPGFDAYFELYVVIEEVGSDLQQVHSDRDDDLTTAMLALHARSCLLMLEVHRCITGGFPFAAWARARSLHENAVAATLLSEHGREPETSDLATRFLDHAVIDHAYDLRLALAAGAEVETAVQAAVALERDRVIGLYGQTFARDYGWARLLFPDKRPNERITFRELEHLADLELDRFDYRHGSHHVHASAWTLSLNMVERGGRDLRLTGPMNLGLAEPALVAMDAAIYTFKAAVHGVADTPPALRDLLAMAAAQALALRAAELLAEGEAVVIAREERLTPS